MEDDKKIVNTKIPILFQKLNTYEIDDIRFTKVKIWLMHLGENLNGSYFDKEIVEDAIPTLANTPILAYIENPDNEDKDYSDHRQELVKEDGQYKIKYRGQAIGVIPETNEAQFEFRLCDDGVEREFLTVQGLLWNKFEDSKEIMDRDKKKAESMELADDYEGEFQEDNLFHFTKFKFYGACGLGEGIEPAMVNASIELDFSLSDFTKEIQTKMEQFKNYIQNQSSKDVDNINNKQEGGNKVDISELLLKYNLTNEQVNFSTEGLKVEDIEVKLQEIVEFNKKADDSKKEPEKKTDFALSNNQLEETIRQVLRGMTVIVNDYWGDPYESQLWYLCDIKDGVAIVIDNQWENYYGIPYTVNGDAVSLDFDNKVAYVSDWRPKQENDAITVNFAKEVMNNVVKYTVEKATTKLAEEKDFAVKEVQNKLDDVQSKFNSLQTENETLLTFKKNKLDEEEKAEKDKLAEERKNQEETLYSKFSKLDGDADYEKIKAEAINYSIEDLEKEIALVFARKNINYSINKKDKGTLKVELDNEKDDLAKSPYGDIFNRYSK